LSSPLLRPPGNAGSRMVQTRGSGETRTTRTTASVRNEGGRPAAGASAKAAPCRAGALRARRPDAWRPSSLPWAAGSSPLRAHPAPAPRVKQAFTVRRRCREDVPNSTRLLPVFARGVIPVTFCGTPCLTCCRCLSCLLANQTALTPPGKPLGKPGLHHSHLPLLHGRAMASQAGRFVLRLLIPGS
jgi:hypothetical protein